MACRAREDEDSWQNAVVSVVAPSRRAGTAVLRPRRRSLVGAVGHVRPPKFRENGHVVLPGCTAGGAVERWWPRPVRGHRQAGLASSGGVSVSSQWQTRRESAASPRRFRHSVGYGPASWFQPERVHHRKFQSIVHRGQPRTRGTPDVPEESPSRSTARPRPSHPPSRPSSKPYSTQSSDLTSLTGRGFGGWRGVDLG